MPRKPAIVTGIDIGTHRVKVVIAQCAESGARTFPRVLGRSVADSKGLRHGHIVNAHDVARSVRAALAAAEKAAGLSVKRAFLAVGGVSVESAVGVGSTMVSRADSEVTDLDVEKALEASEQALPAPTTVNRRVLHAIPLAYKLDGREVLGNQPIGMKGVRLEARTLFITTLEQHLNDLMQGVEDAGVGVLDVMAAPIAASFVTLTRAQKIAGCVLANIGAETVSIIVYENNTPRSLEVFPIGSTDITHDIALGFQLPLEDAEAVKLSAAAPTSVPKKKLDEIIVARLSDIFDLIEAHLKKIGRNALLPAGIVITGGGSGIATIEDLAKASLRLPARVAIPSVAATTKGAVSDSAWSVAYGLCVWGCHAGDDDSLGLRLVRTTGSTLMRWVKQFLP